MSDLPGWLQAARQRAQANRPAWEGTPQATLPQRRSPPRTEAPTPGAWSRTPEAWLPTSPRQALNNPNTVPYYQPPTVEQQQQRQALSDLSYRGEAGRNEVNHPQGAYIGQDVMEMTGAPALARGIGHLRDGEPGEALPEVAMGGLGLIGLGMGAPEVSARAPRLPRVPRVSPVQELPDLPATRRVWHVSPHEFQPEPEFPNGRFRTDLGGSGESSGGGVGALAYGPGGYFTESPGVRDFYHDQFMRTHGRANVYEAEIPHDGYMDFDTPYGRQPSNVREGLKEIYGEGPIAPDADSRVLSYQEAARMRARGVNGTVFRGGIQDADPNLRNYAVFDGADVRMGRRVPNEELRSQFPRFVAPEASAAVERTYQSGRSRTLVRGDGEVSHSYRGSRIPEDTPGTPFEAVATMRAAEDALRQDIATRGLPEYYWQPSDARLTDLYRRTMRTRAPPGYTFSENDDGLMFLRRDAPESTETGRPQLPHSNAPDGSAPNAGQANGGSGAPRQTILHVEEPNHRLYEQRLDNNHAAQLRIRRPNGNTSYEVEWSIIGPRDGKTNVALARSALRFVENTMARDASVHGSQLYSFDATSQSRLRAYQSMISRMGGASFDVPLTSRTYAGRMPLSERPSYQGEFVLASNPPARGSTSPPKTTPKRPPRSLPRRDR